MHPHELLNAMVNDHRRQLIFDAEAFRRGIESRASGTGLIPVLRQILGNQLIRLGQSTIGSPVAILEPNENRV